MGFTVYTPADEDGAQASGLTLTEAFARMMALARCHYSFGRVNGEYLLSLSPSDAQESFPQEPPPECRSKQLDPDKARMEIMRRFMRHGMGGYRIVTDDDWLREEKRRSELSGIRPARRLDAE